MLPSLYYSFNRISFLILIVTEDLCGLFVSLNSPPRFLSIRSTKRYETKTANVTNAFTALFMLSKGKVVWYKYELLIGRPSNCLLEVSERIVTRLIGCAIEAWFARVHWWEAKTKTPSRQAAPVSRGPLEGIWKPETLTCQWIYRDAEVRSFRMHEFQLHVLGYYYFFNPARMCLASISWLW